MITQQVTPAIDSSMEGAPVVYQPSDAQRPPAQTSQPETQIAPIQNTMGGDSQPASQTPQQQEQEKHSRTGSIFHGVLNALGGATDTTYSIDPKTGATIATPTPSAPGEQWKRILAGALTGLAAGATQPRPGFAKGVGVGGVATMQQRQQQDQLKREQAQQEFQNMDKAKLRNASIALQNQQVAEIGFRMAHQGAETDLENAKQLDQMSSMVASDPQNKDWGTYKDFGDFLQNHPDTGNIAKLQAQGMIRAIPTTKDGKVTGVRVFEVHPGWADQKNTEPVELTLGSRGLDTKGNALPPEKQTVPAGGATNGQILAWKQAAAKTQFDQEEKTRMSAKDIAKEGAADKRAELAAKTKTDLADNKADDKASAFIDKTYIKPANDVEKSYQLGDIAFKEYDAARKAGKTLPTGAQSMQSLSQHIANTFGGVKGARITKDLIEKHIGATGISDDVVKAFQKLSNGDVISPAQWDAFHKQLVDSRRITWDIAKKEAAAKGVDIAKSLPSDLRAPAGATAEVHDAQGQLIGHVVNGAFVKLQ